MDNGGGGGGQSPLSYPGTVVTSVGQGATTADTVANNGTGDNFTCSTGPQRMSNAMGVSFCTSTPIRAEAGLTQAQDSPQVAKRRDMPPCHHLEDGMCLTHGKMAIWMFKPSSVVNPRSGKRGLSRSCGTGSVT